MVVDVFDLLRILRKVSVLKDKCKAHLIDMPNTHTLPATWLQQPAKLPCFDTVTLRSGAFIWEFQLFRRILIFHGILEVWWIIEKNLGKYSSWSKFLKLCSVEQLEFSNKSAPMPKSYHMIKVELTEILIYPGQAIWMMPKIVLKFPSMLLVM